MAAEALAKEQAEKQAEIDRLAILKARREEKKRKRREARARRKAARRARRKVSSRPSSVTARWSRSLWTTRRRMPFPDQISSFGRLSLRTSRTCTHK